MLLLVFLITTGDRDSTPSITIEFDYLNRTTWGDSVLNADSNLLTNCWGAMTTTAPWLKAKYGMTGCNASVSGCAPSVLPWWLYCCTAAAAQILHMALALEEGHAAVRTAAESPAACIPPIAQPCMEGACNWLSLSCIDFGDQGNIPDSTTA
jgi:hypothetical protein